MGMTTATTPSVAPTLVQATPAAAPAPAMAPQAVPTYLPETATPNTTRATSIGAMPGKQETVLKDIAGLALSYAQPVTPGGVTAQQNQVLSAWQNNAQSDYGQFMANQGLSVIA